MTPLELWVRSHATIHIPKGNRPILLFSSPRSGSTWLMEIIATLPGIKPIREPMNLRKPEVPPMLKLTDWSESYDDRNFSKIIDYLKKFDQGNGFDYRFKREKPFSKTWHLITNRLIYKILHAGEHQIADIQTALDGDVIFLIRHPIPVGLSREKTPRTHVLLNSDYTRHLRDHEVRLGRELLETGSEWQIGILDWCLQNVVPIRSRHPSWIFLTYEQMVMDPERVLGELDRRLNLPDSERMMGMVYRASGSSGKSSDASKRQLFDPEMMKKERDWLISKWVPKVTDEELSQAFDIIDTFGIDVYAPDRTMPESKYLI